MFCKFLFVFSYANFYGFYKFCKFLFGFMQGFEAVKMAFGTSYLSWGSSPKLVSGSLLLVGVTSPTVVSPPLLLNLQLLLLHVVDPLACVSLLVLS